jgi:hypothetical protein
MLHRRIHFFFVFLNNGRKLRRYLAARLRNAADVPYLMQAVFLRLLGVTTQLTLLAHRSKAYAHKKPLKNTISWILACGRIFSPVRSRRP